MLELCRTCLEEIPDNTYVMLNSNDETSKTVRAKLSACVPELQLNLVKEPVICRNCLDNLQLAYDFKTRCLLNEKRIRSGMKRLKISGKCVLTKLFSSIETNKDNNCSGINSLMATECSPAEPELPSLHLEGFNHELESTNDDRTCTVNQDSNVVVNKDTELHRVVIDDGVVELTAPPRELTFKTEVLYVKEEYVSDDEDLSNDCKTDDNVGNDLVDEEYEFAGSTIDSNSKNLHTQKNSRAISNITKHKVPHVQNYSTNNKEGRTNDYSTVSTDEVCQKMNATAEGSSTIKEENEIETLKIEEPLNEKRIKHCPVKRYNGSKNLSETQPAHSRKKSFCCNVCEYRTTTSKRLISHMKNHNGKNSLSCKICEFTTTRKNNLTRHLQIHTGEKPFHCKICNLSLTRKGDLARHLRIHTGQKPFSCSICGFSTAHKDNLIKHRRIHTGEKPFRCNICEFTTAHKHNLTTHLRTHTGEKPFRCNICDLSLTRKEHLARHIRTHVGEKPFRCNV